MPSDNRSRRLFEKFVRDLVEPAEDNLDQRLGLVVSGPQPGAEQLSILTTIAADQMDERGFFDLVRSPNQFGIAVRQRLRNVEKLVAHALERIHGTQPSDETVERRTWELLSRLFVLMPRLESPDASDWAAVANSLISVARDADAAGASLLRDRLSALATEYPQNAARIDLTLLRRDAYDTLDPNVRRNEEGWRVLVRLHQSAFRSVRDEIGIPNGDCGVRLDTSHRAAEIRGAAKSSEGLLVSGESGVGKSSLAMHSLASETIAADDGVQALCINLRDIPQLQVEFDAHLGCSLATLLCELSAPQRWLIVDGVDAVFEGHEKMFRHLVDAALESGVKVVAVAALESAEIVREFFSDRIGTGWVEHKVDPLTNDDLKEIVAAVPELAGLYENPRSREIMRRLVVVDLLARCRLDGIPLTDADAMQEIWSSLVRRRGRTDRGFPDAREGVLLKLADLALGGGNRLGALGGLDPTALAGLRQDGLVLSSDEDPFQIGPEFAHDELRRYAVARLLLSGGDPSAKLLTVGAPRWSLGAATIACQALFQRPDRVAALFADGYAGMQDSFDALVRAGFGPRWKDVPCEALIGLADPGAILREAGPALLADEDAGLRRLARLIDQRHRDEQGFVKLAAVEPVIEILLEDPTPWQRGEYAGDLLRDWLRSHAALGTAAGQSLRTRLLDRIVEYCAEGDRKLAARRAAASDRSPENLERERRIAEMFPPSTLGAGSSNRNPRRAEDVPWELKDNQVVELLALIGPDLDDRGEAILRRLATRWSTRRVTRAVEVATPSMPGARPAKGRMSDRGCCKCVYGPAIWTLKGSGLPRRRMVSRSKRRPPMTLFADFDPATRNWSEPQRRCDCPDDILANSIEYSTIASNRTNFTRTPSRLPISWRTPLPSAHRDLGTFRRSSRQRRSKRACSEISIFATIRCNSRSTL